MSSCFHIVDDEPKGGQSIYVGVIDGHKSQNVYDFLNNISIAFKFPDYFGYNYDALDECLNDLAWLDTPGYALYIKNYDAFLKDEDHQTKLDTLLLFKDTCNQWANVPNFEGEDDFRRRADFKIYVEQCEAIESDLRRI